MDAHEKEQEREHGNAKKSGYRPEREKYRSEKQSEVPDQRKHGVPDPVFQFRCVVLRPSRAPDDDKRIGNSQDSADLNGGRDLPEPGPWRAQWNS